MENFVADFAELFDAIVKIFVLSGLLRTRV